MTERGSDKAKAFVSYILPFNNAYIFYYITFYKKLKGLINNNLLMTF